MAGGGRPQPRVPTPNPRSRGGVARPRETTAAADGQREHGPPRAMPPALLGLQVAVHAARVANGGRPSAHVQGWPPAWICITWAQRVHANGASASAGARHTPLSLSQELHGCGCTPRMQGKPQTKRGPSVRETAAEGSGPFSQSCWSRSPSSQPSSLQGGGTPAAVWSPASQRASCGCWRVECREALRGAKSKYAGRRWRD